MLTDNHFLLPVGVPMVLLEQIDTSFLQMLHYRIRVPEESFDTTQGCLGRIWRSDDLLKWTSAQNTSELTPSMFVQFLVNIHWMLPWPTIPPYLTFHGLQETEVVLFSSSKEFTLDPRLMISSQISLDLLRQAIQQSWSLTQLREAHHWDVTNPLWQAFIPALLTMQPHLYLLSAHHQSPNPEFAWDCARHPDNSIGTFPSRPPVRTITLAEPFSAFFMQER